MAIHHVQDRASLFKQIFGVLKPGGIFVLGDHVAASSGTGQHLIDRERALERLGREEQAEPERIREAIQFDAQRQKAEGNHCESVAQHVSYLTGCGFEGGECLWQDYWLVVLVARKPKA
jgi:SAM-dependent methyltransferase